MNEISSDKSNSQPSLLQYNMLTSGWCTYDTRIPLLRRGNPVENIVGELRILIMDEKAGRMGSCEQTVSGYEK